MGRAARSIEASLPPDRALIDSHAHLGRSDFDSDRDEVLARAVSAGVSFVVEAGTDAESSRRAIELSRRHPHVRAAVGMHPCDVREGRTGASPPPHAHLAEDREATRAPSP
ncbi:MAG: hypothetical protein E6K77_09935 [Candidatus Eisenbacteria bacterium]|uniref:Uncharacterized protein n=1 Tax=Eiseniibacteriota bacterium TaxID=2212470 RepID=A0A538TD92_UNCEI|nr:MAG: hypothetical protein E6K77_09935 [Candidatus Eisenbacteria bacterium]